MIQLNKNDVDFMSFVSKKVGDGDKTMFWLDPWLDGKLLKNDYPRLFALEGRKEVSVGHKLVNGLSSGLLGWSLNPSGLFLVVSARKFIEEQLSICSGTPTRWIKLVPIKVNILAWRLALDKLPTRLTMSLRGLELPSIHFPVCNSNVESTSYLFFACNVARDISSNILMWRGLPVASYQDWNGWIDSLKLQKEVKEYLEATFLVAWWHIWRYRNSVIFTSIIPKKATLFDNIVSQSFAWCNVRAKRKFSWVSWLQSPISSWTLDIDFQYSNEPQKALLILRKELNGLEMFYDTVVMSDLFLTDKASSEEAEEASQKETDATLDYVKNAKDKITCICCCRKVDKFLSLLQANAIAPGFISADLSAHLGKKEKKKMLVETPLALERHLEEIHVTWAQFWKKPEKMEIGHEDKLKIQDQGMETMSEKRVTPSGSLSNAVWKMSTTMTRSTARKLFEPLNEPEREMHRHKKAARRHQQNKSLTVTGKNLFDDVASSSGNTEPKTVPVPKSLHEHSCPNPSSFRNLLVFSEDQTGRIVDARNIWLIQNVCEFQDKTPTNEPTLAITTRSGTTTRDPSYPTTQTPSTTHEPFDDRRPRNEETPTNPEGDILNSPTMSQPFKSSDIPFPSRLKNQKKEDEVDRLLSIFSQIHINLPFLEAMIYMPKGAKVLKDILSHKEKLEKAASSVKLSEECSAIIHRNFPQKEGDPCRISEHKPTRMSIQLADRSIKYLVGVFKKFLVKINKFIFPVDFVVLEMDEDELAPIILGRPFLATARAIIDVHKGRLSLRVGKETITFNIGKSMKPTHPRNDYMYCADHTVKFVKEQWVDTVHLDGKWVEPNEDCNPEEVKAVSFYPRHE
ncbi:DNA-directed DNA polymerase [Tanacetum coccineum]|uniref:DNA-directed DNA polymerase n=1 Tax=Tanacetum coccineum TaxID=301880 RepID=A0ABQ5GGK9_9ASTR